VKQCFFTIDGTGQDRVTGGGWGAAVLADGREGFGA
jgi:hypothetical protein